MSNWEAAGGLRAAQVRYAALDALVRATPQRRRAPARSCSSCSRALFWSWGQCDSS